MTPPPYLVQFLRHDPSGGLEFSGSGFVLAPGWVLTCWHVLVPKSGPGAKSMQLAAGGEPVPVDLAGAIRVVAKRGKPLDLALVPLPPGFAEGVGHAAIASGLGLDFWRGLEGVDCRAWDGDGEWAQLTKVIQARGRGTIVAEFQISGGLEEGFSGGPVAVAGRSGWVVVGVCYLGGSKSGHSRIYTVDLVTDFLQRERRNIYAGLDIRDDLPGIWWESPRIEIPKFEPPSSSGEVHPYFRSASNASPAKPPGWGTRSGSVSLTILCDFDGTMTELDTTDDILDVCANPMWQSIESVWADYSAIYSRECMLFQSMCIPVRKSVREKIDSYLGKVHLDPGFRRFAERCRRLRVDLVVNSDGFDYAVKKVLQDHGLGWLDVYSNELVELRKHHFLFFPHGYPNCWDRLSKDTQGTCKCMLGSGAVANGRGVILIGNDRTDRCAARYAAEVFVRKQPTDKRGTKNDLVERCLILDKKYTVFESFNEITTQLKRLIEAYGKYTPREGLEEWMTKKS